jgi:uncharacterized protein YgbK (DUF1537 family)
MLLGAVADDLTGATDLALMLSRNGMRTVQVTGVPSSMEAFDDADAVVVALKSRTVPAAQAVDMSVRSARILLEGGARQLFFKYCSTFDSTDEGNIGPVTEALAALVGATFTIACPAYPANGRTIYRGHLFVGDKLLSDSPMKDHPLTPMRDASLLRVLQRQTSLPVSLIAHETVAAGADAISAAFSGRTGIAIVDAISDGDLRAIGAAARSLPLLTGGSGLATGLPENFRRDGAMPTRDIAPRLRAPKGRSVILSGSCSAQTRRQVAAAIAAGVPTLRLDAIALSRGSMDADHIVAFVEAAPQGTVPLVYSSAEPDVVAAVQQALGRDKAGAIVETTLGEAAAKLAARGTTRFLVAGGETSGAVVEALCITAFDIGPEIDPGVPWVASRGGRELVMALKSGNFGSDDFFMRAWTLLE